MYTDLCCCFEVDCLLTLSHCNLQENRFHYFIWLFVLLFCSSVRLGEFVLFSLSSQFKAKQSSRKRWFLLSVLFWLSSFQNQNDFIIYFTRFIIFRCSVWRSSCFGKKIRPFPAITTVKIVRLLLLKLDTVATSDW